ncbi:MAG: lytic murein transglycosylase [Actinomycetota bacterium]
MGPARAQDGSGGFVEPVAVDLRDGSQVEAVLATVGLDAAWRSATGLHDITRAMVVQYPAGDESSVDDLLRLVGRITSTDEQHERVTTRLRRAAIAVTEAQEAERQRTIERNLADAHLRGSIALVQSVAIDLFAGNGDSDDELLGSDGQALVQAQRTMELQGHTLEEMLERREQAILALQRAEDALREATLELERLTANHATLRDEALLLVRAQAALEDEAHELLPIAATAFVLAEVPRAVNLTPRALDAYVRAEIATAELDPRCRISWRTLAAVGRVEGAHGTYGGRVLSLAGRPDDDIVGLPLDGVAVDNFGDTVAAIADTDGGRYDGDPVYDRAVGPMQFIPQTWASWGADGDGDGERDPQDLDDAALAAAGYLCAYGSHSDWENWKTAVFGYNHSAHYVASVKSALDDMQNVRLPDLDGVELWPSRPWGTYVPMPLPDPCEGQEAGATVEVDGVVHECTGPVDEILAVEG